MLTNSAVIEKLKTVYHPEIPVNIYDLGLVNDLKVVGAEAYVLMTLTSAASPAVALLPKKVKNAIGIIPGVRAVHVDLVYGEPRRRKNKLGADEKQVLGMA